MSQMGLNMSVNPKSCIAQRQPKVGTAMELCVFWIKVKLDTVLRLLVIIACARNRYVFSFQFNSRSSRPANHESSVTGEKSKIQFLILF